MQNTLTGIRGLLALGDSVRPPAPGVGPQHPPGIPQPGMPPAQRAMWQQIAPQQQGAMPTAPVLTEGAALEILLRQMSR